MVEDRDDRARRRRAEGAQPASGSLPVARVGHGAGDDRAERRGAARRASRAGARRALAARRGGDGARRLVRRSARACARAAGRSSSRTSTTRTSTTPPRWCSRCERARAPLDGLDGARERAVALDGGHAELRRRLGRVRRRQHARARARAAVPGLRRGDRRAERRRDARTRSRCSPRSGCSSTARRRRRACAGCSSTRSPTARGSGAGAINHVYGTGAAVPGLIAAGIIAAERVRSGARSAGWSATRTRTAAGARTRAPTMSPHWIGRGPSTASQTAWALLALHAAGDARRGDGAGA